jgi:hypothetical protein
MLRSPDVTAISAPSAEHRLLFIPTFAQCTMLGVTLSFLASGLLLKLGNNYFPELGLLCLLLTCSLWPTTVASRTLDRLVQNKYIWWAILYIIILVALGLCREGAQIFDIYGVSRATFLFFVGYILLSKYVDVPRAALLDFLSYSALVSGISAFVFYQFLPSLSISVKQQYPVAGLCLSLVWFSFTGRFLFAVVTLIVFMVATITGSIRQYYILFAICVSCFLFFLLFGAHYTDATKKRPAGSGRFTATAFVIMLLLVSGSIIEAASDYFRLSESRYIQSVAKWFDLASSINRGVLIGESERIRSDNLAYIFSAFDDYFLPNGFVSDSASSIVSIWGGTELYTPAASPVRDSGVVFSVFTFGWLPVCVFGAGYLILFLRRLVSFGGLRGTALKLTAVVCFLVLYILDGGTFAQSEKALYAGTLLALGILGPAHPSNRRIGDHSVGA